jgi:hypothetical protein
MSSEPETLIQYVASGDADTPGLEPELGDEIVCDELGASLWVGGGAAESELNSEGTILQRRSTAKLSECQMLLSLTFSLGVVLKSVLVYLPKKQLISSLIALSHPGGERPRISDVLHEQRLVTQHTQQIDEDLVSILDAQGVSDDLLSLWQHHEMLPAVGYLRQHQIGHRDVSLENILLKGGGAVAQPRANLQPRAAIIQWLLQATSAMSGPDALSWMFMANGLLDRYIALQPIRAEPSLAVASAALLAMQHNRDLLQRHLVAQHNQSHGRWRNTTESQGSRRSKELLAAQMPPRRAGKLQRRSGILMQPGGRHRGKARSAPHK